MKYLNYYLLFNEAKQEPMDIIKKYYSDIDLDILNKLILADPTSIIIDNKVKKIGSYVKFLVKIYRNKGLLLEDLDRAKNYLELYIANKSKLPNIDLLKFNKLSELGKIVRPYLDLESGELTPLIKDLEPKSYKVLFDGDNWKVYQPLSEKAAAVLGYGTEWCTAWGKYSLNKNYKNRSNRFNYYKDNLLIFVNQDTDKPIWQLHLRTEQFNDVNDNNKIDNFYSFLEENPELCPIIFPQLNDLEDKDNLSNILKYYNYLPDYYLSAVKTAYSSIIPKHIFDLIIRIDDGNVKAFLEMFEVDEEYEDYINIYRNDLELKPDFYKSQIRSYYELVSYLNWIVKDGANNFSESYYEDIELEDYLPEKTIFGKGLYEDFNKIGLKINNFEELENYLGNDEIMTKIFRMFKEEYISQYNEEQNTFAKNIASDVEGIIKIDYYDDITVELDKFLTVIKVLFVEKNNSDYKLKLDDVIDKIFSYYNIPSSLEEFQDEIYSNFIFNFDDSEVLHNIQVEIYEAVSDRKTELDEEEKEKNKTDEDRQKEIEDLENIKKNTIQEFNQLLPKLGFKDWIFENEEYLITLFPDNFNDSGDAIFVRLYNKIPNKENEGYITPKSLDSQFKYYVLKITEKIKNWFRFNN